MAGGLVHRVLLGCLWVFPLKEAAVNKPEAALGVFWIPLCIDFRGDHQ